MKYNFEIPFINSSYDITELFDPKNIEKNMWVISKVNKKACG